MSNCSFKVIVMSNKKFSRNKEEKIELIYETFFNLVLKKGYHKISTNHIAKTAKISIGTIYKYFPKGKEDIMRKYFETSMEEILNINDLIVINDDNIRSFLNRFIMDLYKNHEKKVGYNLALRSAIQADKQLLEAHKNKIELTFKEIAQHLRKKNNNFRQIPEEKLIEIFIFLYNLINAIIYHHLAIMKLFESSDRLVVYLSNLVAFSLDYLSKS